MNEKSPLCQIEIVTWPVYQFKVMTVDAPRKQLD